MVKFKPHIEGIEITCDCGAAMVWTPAHLELWGQFSERIGQELFDSAHEKTGYFCGVAFDHKGLNEWLEEIGGINLALGVPFKMDDETRERVRGERVIHTVIDDE